MSYCGYYAISHSIIAKDWFHWYQAVSCDFSSLHNHLPVHVIFLLVLRSSKLLVIRMVKVYQKPSFSFWLILFSDKFMFFFYFQLGIWRIFISFYCLFSCFCSFNVKTINCIFKSSSMKFPLSRSISFSKVSIMTFTSSLLSSFFSLSLFSEFCYLDSLLLLGSFVSFTEVSFVWGIIFSFASLNIFYYYVNFIKILIVVIFHCLNLLFFFFLRFFLIFPFTILFNLFLFLGCFCGISFHHTLHLFFYFINFEWCLTTLCVIFIIRIFNYDVYIVISITAIIIDTFDHHHYHHQKSFCPDAIHFCINRF